MIESNGRLIAVGDIHGCLKQLQTLLKSIDPQPDDTFVFLGDLVDRGPDSKGVIDEVMSLSEKCTVHTILGNHEEMILGAYSGSPSDHRFWTKFGGLEALQSFNVGHAKDIPIEYLNFIANCDDYLESEHFIFVHAGCDPSIPLEANNGSALRWAKFPDIPHMSRKTVVCGHMVQKTILDLGYIICIDTGCGVWVGGKLSAVDLNSGTIWEVGPRSKSAKISQRKKHA